MLCILCTEPVESVLRTGDVLYWRRPNGRISHYLLTVTEDESDTKLLEEYMTHEQFVTLPSKSPGKLSIEVRMHHKLTKISGYLYTVA